MSMRPKISVIIPVYNVEDYIVKCLDSLAMQTLNDIEFICINDGSTDNSQLILEKYASQDSRFIVVNKKNEGPGIARNVGLQMARGEYVGFIDPDDWIASDYYEKLYTQAKELDSDIVIADLVKYQDWDGRSWKHVFWERAISPCESAPMDIPTGTNIDNDSVRKTLLVSPCYSVIRIYKTEFLRKNSIQFSEARCFEDVIFILKSHILARNISYCPYATYFYRLRKTSIIRSMSDRYLLAVKLFQDLREFLVSQNILQKMSLNLDYFTVMNLWWIYNGISSEHQKKMLALIKVSDIDKNCLRYFYQMTNYCLRAKLKKFFKRLFYIKTKGSSRILRICGIKIQYKHYSDQEKKERKYIRLIKKNQAKYKHDCYLLFDCLHDEAAECIDAYSLFLTYRETGKNAYYVCLKNTSLYNNLAAQNKLENIIGLDASSWTAPGNMLETLYPILLRTKAVLTSFGGNTGRTNRFFRKNKSWKYIFLQHGMIFLKESIFPIGYMNISKFDKTLISSPLEKQIFNKYGWSDDMLIQCGLPRWDLLPKKPARPQKKILLMFTWRRMDHVNFEESQYKKNLLSLIQNTELQKLLEQENVKLYFAPHHALLCQMKINFIPANKNIEIVDGENISKYIRECDCLITDFSSVAFDFIFQGKPAILYILDAGCPHLNRLEREDLEKFKYKQHLIPNVVFNEQDVVTKLKHYIQNNFEPEPDVRKEYDSFFYTKSNIREQLIEKIDKICE